MKFTIAHIGTSASIIGAVLVALGSPLAANSVWVVSNPILAWHNYRIEEYEQARMFCVFAVIAAAGVWNLW